ncbi:hypothetical protein FT641_19955 [Bacillus paranthracis]|uniref:hypothetical protein n=1 Tax=Bacillus paranthracis TaxID=2026186 RepID=UPI00187A12DB|nr:hypothetical protein [Bacillus paranthracis]MBE7114664.1 hypothetical protein [Bacillus paranthracis]MBE7154969.1 hypothetical protein [Bacillus paranthracis]
MAKELKVGTETEMRKYRLANGVSVAEVCKELLMPTGLYSAHECGNREYKGERLAEFKQDTFDAINKIVKKRKEAMYDIEQNMCEDDDDSGLIWQCLTDEMYKQAVKLLAEGKNLIQVCVQLEIDSLELAPRLKEDNIDYKNVDADLYETMFPDDIDVLAAEAL